MFLEVLAFNDEILLISNSFCNFAIRKQYRFTIAKYTPYIKPKYVTREGTTVLYVRYNYNRTKRTLISTGYSIKPEHWDSKKRWIKRACPNYDEIDACLIRITSKLGEILTYAKINGISPTVDFVLLELKKNREYELRPNRVDIFDALERYITEKALVVSADQIKDYRTLRKHLIAFKEHSSQPITFHNLNLIFYNEFMDYLFYKVIKPDGSVGLLTNSAGKIIRLLKGFVNYQIDKEKQSKYLEARWRYVWYKWRGEASRSNPYCTDWRDGRALRCILPCTCTELWLAWLGKERRSSRNRRTCEETGRNPDRACTKGW